MSDDHNIIITRPEQPALYAAISEVHRTAFQSDYEPQIVEAIRRSPDFNPKFSIMALFDGQVVGHVLLSRVTLEGYDDLDLVGLGPIGILPAYQGQMVGSALIYESLEVARRAKVAAMFILGDPALYEQFGFDLARDLGFSTKFDPTGDHFMVLVFNPEALQGLSGVIHYHPAFDETD